MPIPTVTQAVFHFYYSPDENMNRKYIIINQDAVLDEETSAVAGQLASEMWKPSVAKIEEQSEEIPSTEDTVGFDLDSYFAGSLPTPNTRTRKRQAGEAPSVRPIACANRRSRCRPDTSASEALTGSKFLVHVSGLTLLIRHTSRRHPCAYNLNSLTLWCALNRFITTMVTYHIATSVLSSPLNVTVQSRCIKGMDGVAGSMNLDLHHYLMIWYGGARLTSTTNP